MTVLTHQFTVKSSDAFDMRDITGEIRQAVQESGIRNGLATAFARHTTAAILIGEHEAGLIDDIPKVLGRLVPGGEGYRHNALNHDDNAHSHLLGSIIGPSETIPVIDGQLALGTWQQVVFIELDTHGRSRQVVVQVTGE